MQLLTVVLGLFLLVRTVFDSALMLIQLGCKGGLVRCMGLTLLPEGGNGDRCVVRVSRAVARIRRCPSISAVMPRGFTAQVVWPGALQPPGRSRRFFVLPAVGTVLRQAWNVQALTA